LNPIGGIFRPTHSPGIGSETRSGFLQEWVASDRSARALDDALITDPEARDPELLKKLDAVAGRVLGR
jgi:hypothetical protein